ncbi:unnamed protein product [Gongylonema pulchrum]|uniref:Uncharacterized protein n=1 Tax=Gongylonema pulchrum TaxID=637853 RepID=A0A183D882_9BILA|nr:unnamed protein product [Gongylonema pulchrum]
MKRSSSERLDQKAALCSVASFRTDRSAANPSLNESHSRFSFFRRKKDRKEREKFELDATDEWIRYSRENLGLYDNDMHGAKIPERSFSRFLDASNALAYKNDLERTIAKKVFVPRFCLVE